MLVLRRRAGEKILIGDDIEIEIIEAGSGRVRIGITAPREVAVVRGEARLTRQQNSLAASLTSHQVSSLLTHLQLSPHTASPPTEETHRAEHITRHDA